MNISFLFYISTCSFGEQLFIFLVTVIFRVQKTTGVYSHSGTNCFLIVTLSLKASSTQQYPDEPLIPILSISAMLHLHLYNLSILVPNKMVKFSFSVFYGNTKFIKFPCYVVIVLFVLISVLPLLDLIFRNIIKIAW